jgi:hypothetical protein
MIVVFGSLFYLMFYGLPWKKLETKRVAVKYLKNQYKQEMIINGIGYNFKSGDYFAEAHTKEPPSINFLVSIDGNGKITDSYRFELWKNQMTEDIKPFLNKLYPNMLKFEAVVFPQGEQFVPKSDIPYYKSFASISALTVWIKEGPDNMEIEYQKAFELLKYSKEHLEQNKLTTLNIYYNDLTKDIYLTEKDIESVQSWQDIEITVKKWLKLYSPNGTGN